MTTRTESAPTSCPALFVAAPPSGHRKTTVSATYVYFCFPSNPSADTGLFGA